MKVITIGSFSLVTNNSYASVSVFAMDYCFGPDCGHEVLYEVHQQSSSPSILSQVNTFISQNQQREFNGQWLLVAMWTNLTGGCYSEHVSTIIIFC